MRDGTYVKLQGLANWGHKPNVGELLDLMAEWVPDETRRHRMFVEHPQALYGF